jgi:uncharacterized membrane protein
LGCEDDLNRGTSENQSLMEWTRVRSHKENTIEARVVIRRSVDRVFSFYRDFTNLPRFLGDVMDVAPIDPMTSLWSVQGPLGIQVHWEVRVTGERADESISYETVTTPALQTRWEVHFALGAGTGETEVRELMRVPLGGLALAGLALIGKFPAREVPANLRRLKELMETGEVTDTSYAVAGKFEREAQTALRR